MFMIIVPDMLYISWFMKSSDHMVTIRYPSLAFGGVRCGCECDTLPWVSSLSHQYPWGSKSPPEALSRFIKIHVHWPFLEYGIHSLDTCDMRHVQKEWIRPEPIPGSLSTISPNSNQSRAFTRWVITTCRLGSIRAIMVFLQSVDLKCHWWASVLAEVLY